MRGSPISVFTYEITWFTFDCVCNQSFDDKCVFRLSNHLGTNLLITAPYVYGDIAKTWGTFKMSFIAEWGIFFMYTLDKWIFWYIYSYNFCYFCIDHKIWFISIYIHGQFYWKLPNFCVINISSRLSTRSSLLLFLARTTEHPLRYMKEFS